MIGLPTELYKQRCVPGSTCQLVGKWNLRYQSHRPGVLLELVCLSLPGSVQEIAHPAAGAILCNLLQKHNTCFG